MSACTASHKTPFFQVAQVKHSGHNRAFVLNCFLLPISYVFKRETSRLLQILRENPRIRFSTFISVHKCTTRWSISKSQEMSWLVYRPKSPPPSLCPGAREWQHWPHWECSRLTSSCSHIVHHFHLSLSSRTMFEFHMSSTLSPSLFTHSAAELNSNSRFFKAFILERPKNTFSHQDN